MAGYDKPKGLSSRILEAINKEVQASRELEPEERAESNYYAKSAVPKTGGYAKCSYIKGDGIKVLPADSEVEGLSVQVRPKTDECDFQEEGPEEGGAG
jgi:hypothetical protein